MANPCHHTTILFAAPKHGGILQSSGFLDLKSLMALNRTGKVNAFDELSLTLFIENEITRSREVNTKEEAIAFCRMVYRRPLLRQWLERDYESIQVSREMLSIATRYEVMLAKMLRTVPTDSEQSQLLSEQGPLGRTLLYSVAESGNSESLKAILALYPESERSKVVSRKDGYGWTVLHCAARTGNPESIQFLLALYPDRGHFNAVKRQDRLGNTTLHCAGRSGNFESIETILASYPESEHLHALDKTNQFGETVLHRAAESNNIECIKSVLSLFPESQRLQVLNRRNAYRETVWDKMDATTRNTVSEWLSEE